MREKKRRCVVLLSGGQDSTTVLYWAREGYEIVHTISFDYGQRHSLELEAAKKIAEMAGVDSSIVVKVPMFGGALVKKDIEPQFLGHTSGKFNLPATFTPGRNMVFLSLAASYAAEVSSRSDAFGEDPEGTKLADIVTGVCETDYSGYPDCRRETMDALEEALTLGLGGWNVNIVTPLMYLTKAQTVVMAAQLPGCWDALKHTITCYNGRPGGCGECPSCVLRAKGFAEADYLDPARSGT